ncbi:MAG: hypothetical protein H6926_04030 [Chromatiales bacterium]|nr:hypothetical protein [Gammaproteobacteria bacterium]MCP5352343.1 hypothetical protein [Chromatiales bacterium]
MIGVPGQIPVYVLTDDARKIRYCRHCAHSVGVQDRNGPGWFLTCTNPAGLNYQAACMLHCITDCAAFEREPGADDDMERAA